MNKRKYVGDKRERGLQAAKAYQKRNVAAWRTSQRYSKIKQRFGITKEQYLELFRVQGGKCAICKDPEIQLDWRTNEVKWLAVDHCHVTKQVRGLLCSNCNQGLGKFMDNTFFLSEAIKYLEK